MSRIPFSIYDFFGYLAAGVLLLAASDYAFDRRWLLRDDLGLVAGVFWTVVAYMTGHIIANIAGDVIERRLVREVLRSPEETLFWDQLPASRYGWRRFFPGHHRPLPAETQARLLAKADERAGIKEPGRALFFHCHPLVLREQATRDRLDTFLHLYGFCRNTSMALLLVIPVLLAGALAHAVAGTPTGDQIWWAIATAPLAMVGMFYRYLKFFREYTIEVLRTCAEVS